MGSAVLSISVRLPSRAWAAALLIVSLVFEIPGALAAIVRA